MRFSVTTLGCKANQYDTGTIESLLTGRGYEPVRLGSGCDVCIINTCAVTAESVRKSRQAVRRARKLEPDALIAVCGCYSELEGAAAELGADVVGGTGDREGFVGEIERCFGARKQSRDKTPRAVSLVNSATARTLFAKEGKREGARTRALLKIQDGCDNRCAYCIIPKARGHSRSVTLDEISRKAGELETQGYKEIVITGIEISSFKPSLLDALRAVSNAASGARIRLGSLHPHILTSEFITELKAIPNLCDHFHISLQSGCDVTLKKMNRRYTTGQVLEAIAQLRKNFDNCGITADLIVGFPGETDEEFRQTLDFIGKAEFSAMHIFPYSPRPETLAATLPEPIASNIKKERAALASAKAAELSVKFKEAQIGQTLEVLAETKKGKHSLGHSGNYLTVAVLGEIQKNSLINVKISSIKEDMLFGEIFVEGI